MLQAGATMDIVKIWGNLLANGGTSICAIPTTYFMQGVQVFAYANEATTSSIESDECTNPNSNPINNEQLQLEEEEDEDDASSDLKDDNVDDNDTKQKYAKRRRRIQRIRYSREEYKCSMCTYTCTTEKAYLRHLRGCEAADKETGSNIEPRLSCPICGKDRNDEQSILAHMNKHKDDKYFCCDICKFKTLQLKKLIQHRRMHTGEKPHLCPYCTYRSARRDNLRSHVRRVHKKDNLTCDTFTPRSMLLTPTKTKNTD